MTVSSCEGHLWRVYDTVDDSFLGGVVVDALPLQASSLLCSRFLFGFNSFIAESLSTAVKSACSDIG